MPDNTLKGKQLMSPLKYIQLLNKCQTENFRQGCGERRELIEFERKGQVRFAVLPKRL